MSSVFRASQSIALEIRDRTYRSSVLSVAEGVEVVVRAPEHLERVVAPPANTPVRLLAGEAGQPLTFFSRVLRNEQANGGTPAMHLAWPRAVERVGRRHVRVDLVVKAEATPVARRGAKAKPVLALTADISEGGVRLTLAQPLALGSKVHLRMHMRADAVVECAGRVVRGGETQEILAAHPFWAAVEFTDLPEATRGAIARLR